MHPYQPSFTRLHSAAFSKYIYFPPIRGHMLLGADPPPTHVLPHWCGVQYGFYVALLSLVLAHCSATVHPMYVHSAKVKAIKILLYKRLWDVAHGRSAIPIHILLWLCRCARGVRKVVCFYCECCWDLTIRGRVAVHVIVCASSTLLAVDKTRHAFLEINYAFFVQMVAWNMVKIKSIGRS